jgi:DNA-binding SARP family transcriptional activator/tetratricopeptide (TPR) repeat protein
MAVLALADARPVSRRLLLDLLWPTRGREQAQASLRQSAHELRGYLAPLKGACLQSERNHLQLRIEHLWTDALFVQTEEFLASQVVDVFRGSLLSDLRGVSDGFDAWILNEQKKLCNKIKHKLASFFADAHGHDFIVKMAEAVLSFDASHQAALTALAKSHAAAGDTLSALDIYHRYLSQADGPQESSAFEVKTALLQLLEEETTSAATIPSPSRNGSSYTLRNSRSKTAFPVPWRLAYLAVSPTRAVGSASPEFARCIDWQLISALCKFEDVSCTPLSTDWHADTSRQTWAEDGFDFLLEGCIDRLGDQDQIIVRLRDLHLNGEVFWSQRLCRPASGTGLFGADFATLLAPQIAAEILKYQTFAIENSTEPQIDVCKLVLRASRAVQRLERHDLSQVDRQLSGAINQHNRHPGLLAWLAYVKLMQLGQGWSPEVAASQRRIGELIDRSLALNPEAPTILSIAGHVLAFTQNRLEEGLSLQEKALAGNPNLPAAWLFSGLAHTYAGEHTEAISRFQRAKLLSPADQHAYFIDTGLSFAYLLNGDTANALAVSRNAIHLNPNFSSAFKVGVSASGYTTSGRGDPTLLQRLLRLEPALTVGRVLSRSPLTRRTDQARLSEGLRLAGLPK